MDNKTCSKPPTSDILGTNQWTPFHLSKHPKFQIDGQVFVRSYPHEFFDFFHELDAKLSMGWLGWHLFSDPVWSVWFAVSIIFHHFPSLSIIFHHFPSFSIIFHHFPSFSITFHHFPSFSITFHHFPSLSIIFHLPTFSSCFFFKCGSRCRVFSSNLSMGWSETDMEFPIFQDFCTTGHSMEIYGIPSGKLT